MNRPFILIMAASAMIHAILLFTVDVDLPKNQRVTGSPFVSVSIVRQPPKKPQPKAVDPKPKAKTPMPKVEPKIKDVLPIPFKEQEMLVAAPPTQIQEAAVLEDVIEEVVQEELDTTEADTSIAFSYITSKLSDYFYYPLKARKKGWQGEVLLSVTVLPSGDIDEIKITKSSGYATLDNAAISSLQKIRTVSDLFPKVALAIDIPVQYKLI